LNICSPLRKIESNFNPTAQASTSSAKGLYQFIDQTWLGTMKQDALAKAETAWRHFTCCGSALSPEQAAPLWQAVHVEAAIHL